MAAKRRAARVATVSQKLLTADFPRWRSVIQRSAATLNTDILRAARKARTQVREMRSTERRVLTPIAALIRAHPSAAKAHGQAVNRLRRVGRQKLKPPVPAHR